LPVWEYGTEEMAIVAVASEKDVGLRSEAINDPANQAAQQPWVEMECVQLSNGKKVAQMDSLHLGSQLIVRERQEASVQKLGCAPADFCALSIGSYKPAIRFSGHSGERGDTVFFMPGNAEFDIHVPAGCETAYIGFSQEEFMRGARVLNPAVWDRPPQGVVQLATHRRSDFKEAVDLWLESARELVVRGERLDQAVLRNNILQFALHVVTVPQDDVMPSYRERLRALYIGGKARAFVDACLDEDALPTVVDICAALGVSERTLQYSFREYVGMSPTAYLRMRRLNCVRTTLAAEDPRQITVTQVAMRFGFLHLGRFSGDYKRLFGETPSETLGS